VGVELTATYRVGNGTQGNVGADTLRHLVALDQDLADRIVGVRNPAPARGGTDPELLDRVRQNAPAAFRTLERAVTPEDYATLAGRHREVQRAQARVRWTGSWRTVFLTVDRVGARPVDAAFEESLRAHLERYRMAGHDLEIDGPSFVALEVELSVCVRPGYFRSDVETALREVLGSDARADGRRGAFHPDNFTFGQPVVLSALLAAAQAVPGVSWAEFTSFQRLGRPSRTALDEGVLRVGGLEIARLDNDPSFPERGVLRLRMKGGR
jgi:predicted phage baseplate assembly protein